MDQHPMTPERIAKLMSKARSCAANLGFGSEADDIAQDVVMKIMQNPKRLVSQITIDYLRKEYGRYKYKSSRTKTSVLRKYEELTEENGGIEDVQNLDFSIMQEQLDSKDRAYITLRYKFNFTESEIGDVFGLSEGRVSQKLKEIKEKLSKILKQDDLVTG